MFSHVGENKCQVYLLVFFCLNEVSLMCQACNCDSKRVFVLDEQRRKVKGWHEKVEKVV